MKHIMIILLGIAVFCSAITVVMARHESRQLFLEIQELKKQTDNLNEEWGRLQLEQSTWATHHRIESISRKQLKMVEPNNHSLMLVLE